MDIYNTHIRGPPCERKMWGKIFTKFAVGHVGSSIFWAYGITNFNKWKESEIGSHDGHTIIPFQDWFAKVNWRLKAHALKQQSSASLLLYKQSNMNCKARIKNELQAWIKYKIQMGHAIAIMVTMWADITCHEARFDDIKIWRTTVKRPTSFHSLGMSVRYWE